MRRISFKLLIYTTILLLFMLGLSFFLQGNIVTSGFKANLKNRMIQYAKDISYKFKNNFDYSSEANNIANIINGRVSIYNANGNIIESYGRFMFGRTRNIERQIILDVLSGKTIYRTDQKTFQGSTLITLGMPIINNNKIIAAIFIHTPLHDIQNDVRNVKNQIFILFIAALLASIIGAYALSSLFTKPILKIIDAAKAIAKGDYNVKIDVKNKDEIGELAKTITFMAQNLSKTEKLRRDFIANTTHELRTPLSIIKSYAEAIYDDILEKDQIKEYASLIMEEAERLNNLINEILELSKLQSGTIQLNIQPISLKNLFSEIVAELNIIKGNRKFWVFEDDIGLKGDAKLLKRAFSNIIINAIHHTKDTGNIYVKADKKYDYIEISIKDDGEGIDDADLPYIFNRFYRTNTKKGIGGLGLSIVKEIIQMHNGEISVFSKKGEGAEFIVKLKC
ncbi:sensor histidine kinase [Caldicellulosiruptor naganoensis]|uniref:histidine kinase n=1 Tax=Caldicellulosiruptor naganoensis TaxID=29324 RepID=A0ABY7BGT5_9FIRM|nr:HAMP domain-containing sensor histidine kinase [Caldicellulosiruptor naganoensis]WAM31685.1 HAMP domain-containing histidine kinase [Caldicellulosiruptor naganoensis]